VFSQIQLVHAEQTALTWQSKPLASKQDENANVFRYKASTLIANSNSQNAELISNNESTTINFLRTLGNRKNVVSVASSNFHILLGGVQGPNNSKALNLIQWDESGLPLFTILNTELPTDYQTITAAISPTLLYVLLDQQLYSAPLNSIINNKGFAWSNVGSSPITSNNPGLLFAQNNGTGTQIFLLESTTYTQDGNQYAQLWQLNDGENINQHIWLKSSPSPLLEASQPVQFRNVHAFGQSHALANTNRGKIYSFNAITNKWVEYQQINAEQASLESILNINGSGVTALVTTDSGLSIVNGQVSPPQREFGWVNMTVLTIYLLFMVAVGLYFVFKNKTTDDYFRGGQSIPWWAAACSIYATMLSSLTYVALPAIIYQTNWVLLIGIWMIVLVAPIAIYVAMPFFRQIDATSAYEYLSKRFNLSVRLFASGLFTLFHIGRMGIVMALTALALSAVTPLTAAESVLIMGVLCLLYCTLGGIEAVIWTDTIQTIVLLIGAVICFVVIISGLEGGLTDFISIGMADEKFKLVNWDFSLDSITTLSIWVIVLGGLGQNLSSYTADQAVVQRYMVTSDPKAAAKSIWTNALIAGPGALLFVCLGTGLYAFYHSYPEKLDPTIQIDQIFPTFIATELPIGLAGLIVAGIFAAAQSTVSTSMNSIATTLVTDFIKPFNMIKTEKGYMSAARWLTFLMGALGTLAGLIFIDPEIRSLMEAYFKVIGMFMGALGGLFVLGALTKKANATGAIIGILTGVIAMISAWQLGWANGYLYATIGIVSCLVVGYLASLPFNNKNKDLNGLTLYTMRKANS
jgi:SSS family transporter